MTLTPVDLSPLGDRGVTTLDPGDPDVARIAGEIDRACRTDGFFTICGHGLPPTLLEDLQDAAHTFFALPTTDKERIAMRHGGTAWRGWFPVGGEQTSGVTDHKEGLYFGAEIAADDPRVQAGTLLHGPNLFPTVPAGLGPLVLRTLDELTTLGQRVLGLMAVGLGLVPTWFATHLTDDPLTLLRIFRYPPATPDTAERWGVAEHTDYGLLTLITQDDLGGLQVHTRTGWHDVPATPGTLVCNIGDMFERLTRGIYRSTPHRVRNPSSHDRLSVPFFLDPSWNASVEPLPIDPPADVTSDDRWDGADVHAFSGTYGAYISAKVAKVFPDLTDAVT